MHRKRLSITLPTDAYRRLAEMAEDEERVIDQQASLLLKRLLVGATVAEASAERVGDQRASVQHDADRHIPAAAPPGAV